MVPPDTHSTSLSSRTPLSSRIEPTPANKTIHRFRRVLGSTRRKIIVGVLVPLIATPLLALQANAASSASSTTNGAAASAASSYPGSTVGCDILTVPKRPNSKIVATLIYQRASKRWLLTLATGSGDVNFLPTTVRLENVSDEDGRRFSILAKRKVLTEKVVQYELALAPTRQAASLFGTKGSYRIVMSYNSWRTERYRDKFFYPDGTIGLTDWKNRRIPTKYFLDVHMAFFIPYKTRNLDMGMDNVRRPFGTKLGYEAAQAGTPKSPTSCRPLPR